MAELILIRGLPGSGKSTMAKREFPDHDHFEADMYHVDEDGNYNWNPKKVKDAHEWCQNSTRKSLSEGRDAVVTNRFTRLWEMEPYFDMGADSVKVVEASGNFKNIHGVPEKTIQAMTERWEDYYQKEEE